MNIPSNGSLVTTIPNNLGKQEATLKNPGGMICHRMEQIYVAGELLQRTVKHSGNLICYGTTVVTGLQMLYAASNPVSAVAGVGLSLVAGKKISDTFSQADDNVTSLLQDAQSGLTMIQTLEAANDQSLSNVKQNLDTASQYVQNLGKKIEEIEHIADYGLQQLIAKKAEAATLYREANQLFAEAQKSFTTSQDKLGIANSLFKKTLAGFSELSSIANSKQGSPEEKLNQFVEIARKMCFQCQIAKQTMDGSNGLLSQGQELLNQAIAKQMEAYGAASAATNMSQMTLEQQKVHNQSMKNYKQGLDSVVAETQKEIGRIEERRKVVQEINSDVLSDLERAEELAQDKFGYTSLILGTAIGGPLGLGYGPLGGLAGVTAGVKVVHDLRNTHYQSVRKVCDYLFGVKVEEKKESLTDNKRPVVLKFDEVSSGTWGRYVQKRPSKTVGEVRINLDSEELSLRFNLNNKNRIAKRDLIKLQKRLLEELKAGSLTPAHCLEIISQLKAMEIVRPGEHSAIKGSFVSSKAAVYFSEVELACKGK